MESGKEGGRRGKKDMVSRGFAKIFYRNRKSFIKIAI
jgi:hypothetical protein